MNKNEIYSLTQPTPLSLIPSSQVPSYLLGAPKSEVDPSLDIKDDLSLVHAWVKASSSNTNTQNSYFREAERAVLYAWVNWQKPLTKLNQEEWLEYLDFLRNPKPTSRWCGPRRSRNHPNWKPFLKGLSETSCRQSMMILKSLFAYATNLGYLPINPLNHLPLHQLNKKSQSTEVTRYLPESTLQLLWESLSLKENYLSLALIEYGQKSKREVRAQRIRFVVELMYHTGARINDICLAKKEDWKFSPDENIWYWYISAGKGNKSAKLPLASHLLELHRNYFSTVEEISTDFLVSNLHGTAGIQVRTLQQDIKIAGQAAILCLEKSDLLPEEKAFHLEKLSALSPHWMRHTILSDLVRSGESLTNVQHFARHSSITTTQRYIHHNEQKTNRSLLDRVESLKKERES